MPMTVAKRTRPRPSPRRTAAAAAIGLLHLAALALHSPAVCAAAVVEAAAAAGGGTAGGVAEPTPPAEEAAFQRMLDALTSDAAAAHQKKISELVQVQAEFDARLRAVERARDRIRSEVDDLRGRLSGDDGDGPFASLERLYEDMDAVEENFASLVRRTSSLRARVGERNRRALGGQDGAAPGLEVRLGRALEEETGRRDRYDATVAAMAGDDATDADDAPPAAEGASANVTPPYIMRSDLEAILSAENIMGPSEAELRRALSALTAQQMQQHIQADDDMWKSRLAGISDNYQREFESLGRELGRSKGESAGAGGGCIDVPAATEAVGKALLERHRDGTNGLVDHAAYENGGSVVHELTSAAHVPPPRNDEFVGDRRAAYEHEKQNMFDEQAEAMYRQQRAMLRNDGGEPSLLKQASEFFQNINVWEWYASFKFGALRPHLPDDWERLLDYASDRVGGPSWSDYTPRGAIDALIPDYVYHAMGTAGRTASPEVAISDGRGAGDDGYVPAPMGRCYPLSMDPAADPAPSLIARRARTEYGGGMLEEDADAALLAGPKYTVRLPCAVAIDAVTLEHRSFPLPPRSLEGGSRGGESAPRWVRLVGFPPCPTSTYEAEEEGEEDECRVRGFDVDRPVDLGSFEYRRITVTGREDDYGGDEDEEGGEADAWPGGRRRSVQTFAVNGGRWTPPSLLGGDDAAGERPTEEDDDAWTAEPEEEMETLPAAGQCAPPKDEDSLPSCGDPSFVASSSSSSKEGRGGVVASAQGRHVVEAVSFIIEENWGNAEYTCLYRVRVHGDAVVVE